MPARSGFVKCRHPPWLPGAVVIAMSAMREGHKALCSKHCQSSLAPPEQLDC